jgi:hypothetical protein
MQCAGCHETFETARRSEDGTLCVFEAGSICICVVCGTILYIVSPGESRIADIEEDEIPKTAYEIAYNIVYRADQNSK